MPGSNIDAELAANPGKRYIDPRIQVQVLTSLLMPAGSKAQDHYP